MNDPTASPGLARHDASWHLDATEGLERHEPRRADDPQETVILADRGFAEADFAGNWAVRWQQGTDEWSIYGYGDQPLDEAVQLAESIATASYGGGA